MSYMIAAAAETASATQINWLALGLPIAGVIGAALIPVVVAWLKKQKLVQKYHLEGVIDAVADRAVHALQTSQKNDKLTGVEARDIAITRVLKKLGADHGVTSDDSVDAVDAAYDRMKLAEKLVPK